MLILNYLWIIAALPLAGAAINGLFGRHWSRAQVNAVGVGSVALAFAGVCELVREFSRLPASAIPWVKNYLPWMDAGSFRVDFALQVDALTIVMLLTVAGVGLLIHIYSTGYMEHEGGYYRFFAYMNLFMFFMLLLVTAANLVVMFVGWEGVGLCSYLLIGFFYRKKSAADAGKKAFITTRIGDLGFMLGIFLAFWTFHTVSFGEMFSLAKAMPVETAGNYGVLTAICLLLFAGAVGKSAQLPLYVWLPDAMEGPTPVSALIHAATMVTAGVYMVARMNVLFSRAPAAMLTVAIVGAVTAFYAATFGLAQTDIKKVLAYSTISQLGYMFLGCGVGAFSAGIFHLMTHAFFKGLLFLAAGSVIHAMGGEQDMRGMGALRTKIPVTFWTMFAATLAIAGFPPFAGFFSKDEILAAAYMGPSANRTLWLVGIAGALLTSFYMFRLLFLTFFGAPRYDEHAVHVHESPRRMTVPLIVLAVLATVGGWFAAPTLWGGENHFRNFLAPVFSAAATPGIGEAAEASHSLELGLSGVAVAVGFLGLLVAWWLYIRQPERPKRLAESVRGLYTLIYNKYYVDEIYGFLIVRPLLWISTNVLWHTIDEGVIDGTVNGAASGARSLGGRLRRIQSGNERSYASWVVAGAVGFTVLVLVLWKAAH
ncbi:MAG: NADH-quinone oxidoreductase subunit L [Candidatus Acidiferrales bacterium]